MPLNIFLLNLMKEKSLAECKIRLKIPQQCWIIYVLNHQILSFCQTEYKLPFETHIAASSLCPLDLNSPTIALHMRLHVCGRNYPEPACLCGVNVGRSSPLYSPSVTPTSPSSPHPRETCHYYARIKIIQDPAARERRGRNLNPSDCNAFLIISINTPLGHAFKEYQ